MVQYTGDPTKVSYPFDERDTGLVRRKSLGSSKAVSANPVSIRGRVPTSKLGGVVPYVVGRRRIAGANIIKFGNIKPIYETKIVTETQYWTDPENTKKGVGTSYIEKTITTEIKIPVGFTVDLICAICLGPDVKLREIWVGENRIWSGNVGPTGTFTVAENDYGLSGVECYFTGGAYDQPKPPGIETDTRYPGIAYIVLKGVRADVGIGELTFEVERYVAPFGSTGNTSNLDINVASAMYDLLTNEWGGMGIPASYLGASFTSAFTYFRTHFGYCSVVIESPMSGGSVMQLLQQQVNSSLFSNPKTGKLELIITSDTDYNRSSAINIGPSSARNISQFQKKGWNDTIKSLELTYSNRSVSYEPTTIVAKGTENYSPLQSKKTVGFGFPYVCQEDVAVYISKRLLAEGYVPTFSGRVTMNRQGADAVPGSVSLLSWPHWNLWSVPVIIDRVRKNPLSENTVDITFRQWSTPDGADITVELPKEGDAVDFGYIPQAPIDAFIQTAPFWLLREAGILDIDHVSDVVYPMFFPVPASPLQAFVNVTLERAGVTPPSYIAEAVSYPAYGTLDTPIDKYDGWTTGVISNIELSGAANVGDFPDMSANPREGRYLVLIDHEIFTFETKTDLGGNRIRLNNLRRAVIDTVAANHVAGSSVFIVSNAYNYISSMAFPNPLAYTPTWRFVSNTLAMNGKLDRSDHTLTKAGWVPVYHRSFAPPRPHDTKINGVRNSAMVYIGSGAEVSWRIRTRVAPDIKFQTDASELNEPTSTTDYQFHRVYIRDSGGTLRLCGTTSVTDEDQNTLSISIPSATAAGPGTLFVRSVVNNIESVFDDELPVYVVPNNYRSIQASHEPRETEDGEVRIVE